VFVGAARRLLTDSDKRSEKVTPRLARCPTRPGRLGKAAQSRAEGSRKTTRKPLRCPGASRRPNSSKLAKWLVSERWRACSRVISPSNHLAGRRFAPGRHGFVRLATGAEVYVKVINSNFQEVGVCQT
jgi:hypothetical protein